MSSALYARVSTKKEEQEHGLKSQVHACRRFLEDRKLGPIVRTYEEQASGRKREGQRHVLRELLHDAAMHRFQVLVVFRLDRLTRGGISEMFRVLKDLQGYGVRVYSVSETWWDPENPTHELILAVLAWAAQFESRAIAQRVTAGIAARRAETDRLGEPFLWGGAKTSLRSKDPGLPPRARALRRAGKSWAEISRVLKVSRTSARRLCHVPPAKSRGRAQERRRRISAPSR